MKKHVDSFLVGALVVIAVVLLVLSIWLILNLVVWASQNAMPAIGVFLFLALIYLIGWAVRKMGWIELV